MHSVACISRLGWRNWVLGKENLEICFHFSNFPLCVSVSFSLISSPCRRNFQFRYALIHNHTMLSSVVMEDVLLFSVAKFRNNNFKWSIIVSFQIVDIYISISSRIYWNISQSWCQSKSIWNPIFLGRVYAAHTDYFLWTSGEELLSFDCKKCFVVNMYFIWSIRRLQTYIFLHKFWEFHFMLWEI
jgi:hypothetical protein